MPTWTNQSLNIEVQPHALSRPVGYGDVLAIVQEAQRQGRHVRAVGRGWSFTPAATCTDFMIDTRGIRGVLALSQGRRVWGHRIEDRDTPDDPHVDNDPIAAAGYPADRSWALIDALRDEVLAGDRRLVHVLAGTTVRELYEALDAPERDRPVGSPGVRGRWTVPTMGGASGQTIAGALGTGTHGGDFDLPPMADMVRAVHLIAPDGTQRWIEPARDRITDATRLHAAMRGHVPREHLHYDDELFDAALVSLGALGFIFSYVIEVRAQYGLSEVVAPPTSWAEIRPRLLDGSLFGDGPGDPTWLRDHPTPSSGSRIAKSVGIFLNPYRSSGEYATGDGHAERAVMLMTQAEAPDEIGPPRTPATGLSPFDSIHLIAGFERADTLRATASIVQGVFRLLRDPSGSDGFRRSTSVLDTTGAGAPVVSFEIAITTAGGRHVALIDDMLARFDAIVRASWPERHTKFAGAFALRFTRPTRALLGMQAATGAVGERFCHIEIPVVKEVDVLGNTHQGHSAMENDSELFIRAFEEAVAHHGGRMHWGQMSLAGLHRAERYSGHARFMAARDRLTNGGRVHTFDNAFTVLAGLVRCSPSWAIRGGMVPAPPPTRAPTSTIAQGRAAATVIMNPATQCNELFVIAGDGQLARCMQRSANAGWGGWELLPHGVRMQGKVAAVSDGITTYAFARDADGNLYQTGSPAAAQPWGNGAWGRFSGVHVVGSPAAILDRLHVHASTPRGWPYVAARCSDGRIRCATLARTHTRPGHFGDWEHLPALPEAPAGDPVLAIVGNVLIVHVRCVDGSVWSTSQPIDRGWGWNAPWRPVGTVRLASDPVIASHADGRLEIFGRGTDGRLWIAWQDRPNGPWLPWERWALADFAVATDAVLAAHGSTHAIAVVARDVDRRLHMLTLGHGRGWRDTVVAPEGPSTVGEPALGSSADGRLELFSRAGHDLVTHRWERTLGEW